MIANRMRIIILGAGGHAQVIADTLLRACEVGATCDLVGFLDDNPVLAGQVRLGLPILGSISTLTQHAHDSCAIGIGDNRLRAHIFRQLRALGEHVVTVIHPRAVIAPDVTVGAGVVIFAGVVVNTGTTVGENVVLNTGCTVDHHNIVADHAHIAPGAHLGGDVRIGEGALVGIGATVMPQRSIGVWSVVGAGALVHRDVLDRATVIGVPATAITQLPTIIDTP
jgi:sugar O-acyltransferase (sialic acid O-acetyltransferase NeuD family)